MKRIYLLLVLLLACIGHLSAQRSVNLAARPHFIGTSKTSKHLIANGEKLLYNGDGTSIYWFTWIIKNLGPDTLKTGDSLYVRRAFNSTSPIRYVYPAGKSLKVNDSIGIIPVDGSGNEIGIALSPNSSITTSKTETGIQWCDSVWAQSGTTVVDPSLTNNKYCTSVDITFWLLGVNTVTYEENGFLLFPNPATNELNFKFDFGVGAKNVSVALRDVVGKVVYSRTLGNVSGSKELKIDVSAIPKGMYVAELNYNGQKIVSKLSLQ